MDFNHKIIIKKDEAAIDRLVLDIVDHGVARETKINVYRWFGLMYWDDVTPGEKAAVFNEIAIRVEAAHRQFGERPNVWHLISYTNEGEDGHFTFAAIDGEFTPEKNGLWQLIRPA